MTDATDRERREILRAAEMRWMSVEDATITVPARELALLGRALEAAERKSQEDVLLAIQLGERLEAAEADARQKETHARNRERELLILFSEAEARAEAAEADARQYREAVEAIVAAFRGIRVNEITDEDIGRNRGTQHGALLLAYRALGRA